jgi:hypothetical protein
LLLLLSMVLWMVFVNITNLITNAIHFVSHCVFEQNLFRGWMMIVKIRILINHH